MIAVADTGETQHLIIIDEYAELADDPPEATKHADSIAHRGRAVAVNLVAATQRPTQGMLAAGWHAHTLNAPGKFLVAAVAHDAPERARAYLITDQAVAATAATYADVRAPLDPISRPALDQESHPERDPPSPVLRPCPCRRR